MKALFLFLISLGFSCLLLGQETEKSTANKATHIRLHADTLGVYRFELPELSNCALKLLKSETDTSRSVICFGDACYRSNQIDCLPESEVQKLSIAWYGVPENQINELQLISCTDNTLRNIFIHFIP